MKLISKEWETSLTNFYNFQIFQLFFPHQRVWIIVSTGPQDLKSDYSESPLLQLVVRFCADSL